MILIIIILIITTANITTVNITMISTPKEEIFKIVIAGDQATGSSSIVRRYVHGMFSEHYKQTIGADFALKVFNENDVVSRMQLWDIAGQEKHGTTSRIFFKDAKAVVFVCDITRPSTLSSVEIWNRIADNELSPDVPKILLINKIDLADDIVVSSDQLDELCPKLGINSWFAVSAKTNIGINDAFEKVRVLVREYKPKIPKEVEISAQDIANEILENNHLNDKSMTRQFITDLCNILEDFSLILENKLMKLRMAIVKFKIRTDIPQSNSDLKKLIDGIIDKSNNYGDNVPNPSYILNEISMYLLENAKY